MTKRDRPSRHSLQYLTIRNISSVDDNAAGRKVLCGQASVHALLAAWDEAVGYPDPGAESGRAPALRRTLAARPKDLSFIHGSVCLGSAEAEIDDKSRTVTLSVPFMVSGADILRELEAGRQQQEKRGGPLADIQVSFEILVSSDRALMDEAEAARSDPAGTKLQPMVERAASFLQGTDGLDRVTLLQVLTAMVPPSIWPNEGERGDPDKAFAYGSPYQCVMEWAEACGTAASDSVAVSLVEYADEFSAEAAALYLTWKRHPALLGSGLWKDEAPDGIVFPVLAALSSFTVRENGRWTCRMPERFPAGAVANTAMSLLEHVAGGDPAVMGSSKACYSTLLSVMSVFPRAS